MKHSTTLLALGFLIVGIVWGCSSTPPADSTSTTVGSTSNVTSTGTPSVTGSTAATTTTAGTSTTGGLTCVAPQQNCGGVCIDLYTNAQNCGACGVPCPAGYGCSNATCTCSAGTQDCGAGCVDVQSSATNCGACGTACGVGQLCQAGVCSCQAGLTACTSGCTNTISDVNNCGACGTACGAQVCSQGACSATCAVGEENCGGSCLTTAAMQTDPSHCGGCDVVCATGLSCVAGVCECQSGHADCGVGCVDTQASTANCGACGTACPTGATCTAGTCACPEGQELCGSSCVATGTCVVSACGGKANSEMISDFEGDIALATTVTGESGLFSGLWEGFGDAAGSWSADAVVEAVTDAECGTQALHAAGQSFQSYVGIGFSLLGDDPANINWMTDTYDGSAWKGIRFKAKKGTGTLTPVRFNIATPGTEAAASGGTCDDTVAGHDCYNHPGRFLEGSYELTTSWRTYHFCFDRDLYPQFLPSTMTNAQRENVASNILKMQFIFNKAIDPSVQNIDDSPTGGEYAISTAFDFWIDDVEFTNDACPENLFAGTGSKAFPQNAAPGACTLASNASVFNTALSEYYAEWKQRFLRNDGGVFSPEDNRVISEGMGYGMLLAVAFGDKTAFDQMWGYVSARLGSGGGTLMTWVDGGSGSATDADADIAYALLLAGDQWGGDYATRASTMIGGMGADVASSAGASGDNVPRINAGSNWGTQNVYNNSYFTPGYYSEFGGNWGSSILSNGYTILQKCNAQFGNHGLVPDWCQPSDGVALDGNAVAQVVSTLCAPGDCKYYAFDAARVPWRVGVDACLNDRAEAKTYLTQLIGHFASLPGYENGARIDLMRSGYRPDGGAHANSAAMQASFIGPVGVGAMAVNPVVYQRAFRTVLDIMRSIRFNRTYYPATVGLLSLLEMTGNIPHR